MVFLELDSITLPLCVSLLFDLKVPKKFVFDIELSDELLSVSFNEDDFLIGVVCFSALGGFV